MVRAEPPYTSWPEERAYYAGLQIVAPRHRESETAQRFRQQVWAAAEMQHTCRGTADDYHANRTPPAPSAGCFLSDQPTSLDMQLDEILADIGMTVKRVKSPLPRPSCLSPIPGLFHIFPPAVSPSEESVQSFHTAPGDIEDRLQEELSAAQLHFEIACAVQNQDLEASFAVQKQRATDALERYREVMEEEKRLASTFMGLPQA
jgi:hypothetical protein